MIQLQRKEMLGSNLNRTLEENRQVVDLEVGDVIEKWNRKRWRKLYDSSDLI